MTVLIPNRDHVEDLKRCIDAVLCSDYCNYEIVVVEHNSKDQQTFAYYEKLQKECSRARVLTYTGEENISQIYNFAVKTVSGEYLLLLDPLTQMINTSFMSEMLGYCMREDVGIVGAKLIYEDDTIAHAGIVLGFGGAFGYVFRGKSRYIAGYESRVICAQDYSAVSGACMMVKRSVYEEAGGMTEEFSNRFHDIDFCLKARKAGWLVVYNPYAEGYYYGTKEAAVPVVEGKTKDNREAELLVKKWETEIKAGDPYYNPNLTLDRMDFSLRR